MAATKLNDQDFIAEFERLGARPLAREYGYRVRSVNARRVKLEARYGRQITGPDELRSTRHRITHDARQTLNVHNGVVLVGSDAHYWPDLVTTAHKAFVRFCAELRPVGVVLNGDVFDGASVSRHPPIGWEHLPTVQEEIEACQARTGDIERAAPKAKRFWTLGNHDARFETRLATVAPEYARINGFHLKDHFPLWETAWSVWINDRVVIKHRFKGGIHATHNNTLWSGKTIITGHLHSLKVTPFSDYNGTRWGVDSGTLAEPAGPMFIDYLEDNPVNWRSGFIVLTFEKGELRWPEVVNVIGEGRVEFRGQSYRV